MYNDGFDPWLDEKKLLPGQEWEVEIPKAVKTSDVVIVCLSHKAINKSGYVQKEIKFALDKAEEQPEGTIFLIPLKLEECDVPERLQRWQWVNLFEEEGHERLMSSLRIRAEKINSGSESEPNLIQGHEKVTPVKGNETIIKIINNGSKGPVAGLISPLGNMEFVLIQPGEFDMGSPANETGRYDDEGPIHHVTISEAFYLGKYEVKQKQWYEVMGDNPSHFKGDDLPVENVSWDDVQEFIKKLNKKEDTHKYRLPSEAEWEYAARAGTTTRYSFGDDDSELKEYAWFSENLGDMTHPVGKKGANPWGLYDVHGNIWEWVQDERHDTYNGAPIDGSAWRDGVSTRQVVRGGCWFCSAWACRSAYRKNYDPGNRRYNLGFRLLKEE
ncbi:MAG: Formylglycine-generating enzyme, required for sulfatase activity, contains SUMF1/FGE domain [Candidatus Methanocomedens sp.]|nr:MAG: Formylglycine-generating enzyme, required for sulfatase activity, contains SUMF1/FGE domain [ANME-2 cluster archaeon]